MRENLLSGVMLALQHRGYTISSFLEFNSCFDIAAKKNQSAFIIKTLSNIDSIRPETALELQKAAALFEAMPILIGEKTKAFNLQNDTWYERFEIPVFSVETFSDYLDGKNPSIHSFKGKETVQLDREKLVAKRLAQQLTQEELAQAAGVSSQTIHRYENGAPADYSDALRLEQILKSQLIDPCFQMHPQKVDRSAFESVFFDPALEKLHDLGIPIALFSHAPFKAFANPSESILVNLGKDKREIQRKALVLEKTKTVFKSHSIVISKEYKLHTIGKTPVIQEEELESFSKKQEFLNEIAKREKKEKTN